MLIDARQQFEKEPKAFSFKRNRMTDAHRAWVEERYFDGWARNYSDEQVKIFRREDFAYHKVAVVFWQTDENDKPAIVTEPYEKSFTAATVAKEQAFYCCESISSPVGAKDNSPGQRSAATAAVGNPSSNKSSLSSSGGEGRGEEAQITFRVRVKSGGKESTITLAITAKDNAARKFKSAFADADEILSVEWTHRHYVADDEYIPFGEDIKAFLKREIAKPIIRWEDSPQLGYEILPNKYFYRYQPPTPAKELLAEFWRLEKEAEKMLEGLTLAWVDLVLRVAAQFSAPFRVALSHTLDLVERILRAKRAGPDADATALEREIDSPREISLGRPMARGFGGCISRGERAYRLYGLTPRLRQADGLTPEDRSLEFQLAQGERGAYRLRS